MKPILAHVYAPKRILGVKEIYVQPKLNGVRALYQDGHFQSRDDQPWNDRLLRHISSELKSIFPSDIILDGELYVHGWPLQRINAAIAVNRQTPTDDTYRVEYHIFDVVDFHRSFDDRYGVLSLPETSHSFLVETHKLQHPNLADDYYVKYVSLGYEGMMYRLGNCPYTWPKQLGLPPAGRARALSDKNNRCWHLLKRKDWRDDEFECIGVEEGEGKRSGMVGAFVCETPSRFIDTSAGRIRRVTQFRVGTGFTEAQAIHYFEEPPIGRKLKIKYLVLSRDSIPLNPSLIAVL